MNWKSIYGIREELSPLDLLGMVTHLAQVGAAASDTTEIPNMDQAQCALFGLIYTIADEAIEAVEMSNKRETHHGVSEKA